MLPRITVVTPSFNQGAFLQETIESVLNQQYPNLEYMIVDGGSNDNSVGIIKMYESKLNYWISEKDRGQSDALNKGLRRATGEIVTWLNSDDVYLPGVLHRVAEYFVNRPDVFLLHGKTVLFGNGIKEEIRSAPADDLESRYLAYIPFPQPSSFFRRRVLEEQGYLDDSLHYGMDFDLLARIALNYKIEKAEEIFSRYRMHESSKSNYALGFANDWNVVFSRILRSLPGSESKIEQLKELGLYDENSRKYNVTLFPDEKIIDRAYLHFLKAQAQMYYIAGDTRKSERLFKQIKRLHPAFYENEKLSGIHRRSALLSPSLLKLIRTIKG